MSQRRGYLLNSADLQRDKVRRESNMIRSTTLLATASIVALAAAFALPARGQDVLPRPEQTFKGHIGRTVEESTKDFPQEVKAPKGGPNILSSPRTMLASAQAVHLADRFRRRPWIDSLRRVFGTQNSTPRHFAHRLVRRS
jgi:hypothetical protein